MKNLKKRATALVACVLTCLLPLQAADVAASGTESEIEQLKKMVAEQQRQIEELRHMLSGTALPAAPGAASGANQPAEPVRHPSTGEVASTTPIVPLGPVATTAAVAPPQTIPVRPAVPASNAPDAGQPSSPLQIRIGDAYITPVGFMDFTSVTRNVTTGASIGTNFGSIPYSNTPAANLSETRLSTQNSRIGLRVDALVKGAKVLGYLESDFLGFVPANAAVTSNSDSLRLRLYWVDVRKGPIEFLGGQSWSMLTPSRRGIGALPGDLFYGQVMDTNYLNGLVWSRQSGFRVVAHPNNKWAIGLALENAEQYVGGSGGGGVIVAPAAVSGLIGTQFNNGTTTLNVPALHPDIIAKVAFDPTSRFHLEVGGVERTFKDYVPATNATFTKAGGGVQLNLGYEVVKGLRLITNNYYSYGGGRYLFGIAPDLILRNDGSISPLHSSSTTSGFEWTKKNTMIYGYYGGIYIGRNSTFDPSTGKLVGYGYPGSTNAQNRSTQEVTFGINPTFWKDAKYGSLSMFLQYAYVTRNPWVVATGTPNSASAHMAWVDLRYTLPGSAPTITER